MPLWKVTREVDDFVQTRIIKADRRSQVESFVLQDFTIERIKQAEDMIELRDVEVEEVK